MNTFVSFITKHPRKILGFIFLTTLFMFWGVTKLEVRNNQDSELPADDPIVATMDRIEEIFDDKSMVIIGIKSTDIYTTETLQKISDISEALQAIEWIIPDEVNSLSMVNTIKSREWGLETGPFMKEVPTTAEGLAQLKKDVVANENIYGQLVSEDGTFSAIVGNVQEDYDQALLHQAVYAMVEKYKGSDEIYVSGEPIWLEDIETGIAADSGILVPVALGFIFICFFFCFRTLNGVFLPVLVVILSIVWTMGMMGHLGLPMTVVSNALPILMVAVASSYGIHMVHRYYEERQEHSNTIAVQHTVRSITPPIILTGITSALGAGTLVIFKVTSMKEFGVISAIGILAALILSITVIPSIYMVLKNVKTKQTDFKMITKALHAITAFSFRNRKRVLVGYLVLGAICCYGITKIIIGVDISQNFPETHKGRIAVNTFNENLGGVRAFNIMIEGDAPDALKHPDFLRKIMKFQHFMEQQEGVGNVFSFANIIKRMHHVIDNEGDTGNQDALPNSQDVIAQYLLLYSMSGDPGDFKNLIDFEYQRAKVQVMLTTSDPQRHEELYTLAQDYLQENITNGSQAKASFGGDVMFWIAQIGYIVKGKIENILLSVLIMLIVCSFVFRSIKAGIFSIIPLIFSALTTFALMGFFKVKLEMGTAILTAMLIGIGVDFAIHYLSRFREESAMACGDHTLEEVCMKTADTSGRAITFDVLSNVVGFSVLVISEFLPIRSFGLLLAISMFVAGFNTMCMFPALIGVFKPSYFMAKPTPKTIEDPVAVLEESTL